MNATLNNLLERMYELRDLRALVGLATWDQETNLPEKGEEARGSQLATLQGLCHERLVDPALGALLDEVLATSGLSADHAAMARVLRRERDRAVRVPGALVRSLAKAQSAALAAWKEARAQNRFAPFAAPLERLLTLRREQADALGHSGQRYDALLDAFEPDMTCARLSPVLTALKGKLQPFVERLAANAAPAPAWAGRAFEPEGQWAFALRVLRDMGFDFERGRLDKSVHPFTTDMDPRDVRLTLRIDESTPLPALFGAIHEGGHGLFEQGFDPAHYRTPLAASPSMGLHESQSRLWENIVGRGRPFWTFYFPRLVEQFPKALAGVGLEAWLAHVNRVERSLVRTGADEVTYNLHIVLRYELELALLSGDLAVADLPGAWSAKSRELLGRSPPDELSGALQDIHWAFGELGYFPTYALGNLYAASLWAALRRQLPDVEARVSQGELSVVTQWLREKVHQPGYLLSAEERVRSVTGRGLTDQDFVDYLTQKYGR